MKTLVLLVCTFSLLAFNAPAQILMGLNGDGATAIKYKGKYVYVTDTVRLVKIINSSHAYLVVKAADSRRGVTIILNGKGTSRKAYYLKGKEASFEGRMKIISGEPTLVVSDFKRIGSGLGCKCLVGDPFVDEFIPVELTPAQDDSLKNILLKISNAEEPGLPLKDVIKYVGHEVYVRDSIVNYKQYSKSFTVLYIGGNYPDHIITIIIKGEKLNDKNATWRKKGIGRFTGKVTMFQNKPAIIVTNQSQLGMSIQI